jgi:hypothetical protein
MKVKLHTTYAGPAGTHQPGAVIDVNDKHGQDLIDGGFAFDPEQAEQANRDRIDAMRAQKREQLAAEQAEKQAAEKAVAKAAAKAAARG